MTASVGRWLSPEEFYAGLVELEKLYQPQQIIVELKGTSRN